MERAGFDLDSCAVKYQYVNSSRGPYDFDAVAYIISANIHRRHLSKSERADLIVAAVNAEKPRHDGEETVAALRAGYAELTAAWAKGGRGKVNQGKAKACDLAAEHGISKRTIQRARAKAEGKTPTKPASSDIAAARKRYLSMFAELDRASMVNEMLKLTGALDELIGKARQRGDTEEKEIE